MLTSIARPCGDLRGGGGPAGDPLYSAGELLGPCGGHVDILVVEDNPLNLRLMETILTEEERSVQSAVSGAEAIKTVSETEICLVPMDLNMKPMNGFETLAAIRAIHPELKIIAVTGNTTSADRQKAIAAGFDDFLPKPYTIAALMMAISGCLPDDS